MARDPYEILGVSPDASDEEVHRAFRRRVLPFQPDRHRDAPQDVQDEAARAFGEVMAAWEAIQDERDDGHPSKGSDSNEALPASGASPASGSGSTDRDVSPTATEADSSSERKGSIAGVWYALAAVVLIGGIAAAVIATAGGDKKESKRAEPAAVETTRLDREPQWQLTVDTCEANPRLPGLVNVSGTAVNVNAISPLHIAHVKVTLKDAAGVQLATSYADSDPVPANQPVRWETGGEIDPRSAQAGFSCEAITEDG